MQSELQVSNTELIKVYKKHGVSLLSRLSSLCMRTEPQLTLPRHLYRRRSKATVTTKQQ